MAKVSWIATELILLDDEHNLCGFFACIYMARRYYYLAEKHYRMLFQKTLTVGNVFLRINTAQSISNYQK